MKLWFSWIGYRKDGRNKAHIWGVLNCDEGHFSRKYVVWGPAQGPIFKRECSTPAMLFSKKDQKIKDGYRQIGQDSVEKRWPELLDDLEMQFMMERLINV